MTPSLSGSGFTKSWRNVLESYAQSSTVRKPVDVVDLTRTLRDLARKLVRWSVFRDLTSLGSGTLLSQLILLAGGPIVLRLSRPADFGLYAVAYGLVTLLATLSTCKIERLIVGVAERRTAIQLLATVFLIGSCWTVLFFAGLLLNHLLFRWVPSTLQAQPSLMWLVPVAIFVQLSATGLRFYAMRTRLFTAVAVARVSRSVVFIGGSSVMMLLWPLARTHGAISLLTWQIAGDLCALLVQLRGHRQAVRLALFRPRAKQGLKVVLRYWRTLGALAIEQVLGDANQQITIWTVVFAYGAVHAGWYSIATTMVTVPSTVLALPLADLLYQRLSRADAEARTLARLVLHTTMLAAVGSIIPFGALLVLGPSVLSHVIGPQWSGAAQSIMILATGTYLFCVTTPATAVPVVLHRSRFIVLRQALQAPAVVLCCILAGFGLVSYTVWLLLLVVCRSLIYIVDFVICYSLASSAPERSM